MELRDKILNAKDIKSEIIKIDEWDVEIEVFSLTAKKRSRIISEAMNNKGLMDFEKLYPDLVIACSYDPVTHKPIFNIMDRDLLNEKSGGALEKIAQVALKLSGLDNSSVDNAIKN